MRKFQHVRVSLCGFWLRVSMIYIAEDYNSDLSM